jgi:transcriptional regulator with XRE-family HTH domain
VGRRIRELREQQGWTQEDLAERVERSQQTVSGWESGARAPGRESLETLAEVFETDIDSLLRRASGPVVSIELSDEEHEQLLAALRAELASGAEQLSWNSIMTLIGLAAWLFHLERRPLAADDEHGPFDGVEDYLYRWQLHGDLKDLNDFARSAVRARETVVTQNFDRLMAARSAKLEEAEEVQSAAKKAVRKPRTKPRPRAGRDEP